MINTSQDAPRSYHQGLELTMNIVTTFYCIARYFLGLYVPFIIAADLPQALADLVGLPALVGEVLSNVSHIALFIFAYNVSRQPKYVAAIGATYTIANIATVFQSAIATFIFNVSFTSCLLLLSAKFYVARHQIAAEVFERMSRT